MSRPTIGVVIATPGRRSLIRTLNSILYQGLEPGDDFIIVGDGYHEPTAQIIDLLGPPFRYVATKRTRDWGHSQANYGLREIKADWVIMQDDDDIFLPRAFDEMRTIISKQDTPKPIIGRVMTPYLGILWTAPGVEPLDGHCLLVPNNKKLLGYYGLEYAGDQKWLASNLEAYDSYAWADRIWTLTRPGGKLWPIRQQVSGADVWMFCRDDEGMWSDESIGTLIMRRDDKDIWHASFTKSLAYSPEECKEIVEFAAWAGQGSDVWFTTSPMQPIMNQALEKSGYKVHSITANEIEYTFEWPPHQFIPPPK